MTSPELFANHTDWAKKNYRQNYLSLILITPYLIVCLLFLILPMLSILISSLKNGISGWHQVLINKTYLKAFKGSLLLSCQTSIEASIAGGVLALLWVKKLHRHGWFLAFVNFAANNGGISLAFSLLVTLGVNGMLTLILRLIGINLYPGFQIASLNGLHWAYLSFLVPFMTLIFLPAAGMLRDDWFEAARSLGAGKLQYSLRIAAPVLLPFFISSFTLVFLQALGNYATAQAITDSRINLVTLQIGYLMQMSLFNRADANVLSLLLVVLMFIVILLYEASAKRASRWLK